MKEKFQKEIDTYSIAKKERDQNIAKLERQIKDKDYDLQQLISKNKNLEEEIRHLNEKLERQDKSFQEEYERKFDDLKKMYSE